MKAAGAKETHLDMSNPKQNKLPDIPCVVLAGGKSRRFGSNKAFATTLHGERLVDVLIKRLELQTSGPIAINAVAEGGFENMEQEIVPDRLPGHLGPLAGIHAAMHWAGKAGYSSVITTPVDTPALPARFVEKLVTNGAPAVAISNDRMHAVHGIWPTNLVNALSEALMDGMRAARDWTAKCEASLCEFNTQAGLDPFFNINTPEDLQMLENTQPVSPR